MADKSEASILQCPLCGYRFDKCEQAGICHKCPLATGCKFVRCPKCDYEWTDESRLVNWFKRLMHQDDNAA